jgi:hypothetical protein
MDMRNHQCVNLFYREINLHLVEMAAIGGHFRPLEQTTIDQNRALPIPE